MWVLGNELGSPGIAGGTLNHQPSSWASHLCFSFKWKMSFLLPLFPSNLIQAKFGLWWPRPRLFSDSVSCALEESPFLNCHSPFVKTQASSGIKVNPYVIPQWQPGPCSDLEGVPQWVVFPQISSKAHCAPLTVANTKPPPLPCNNSGCFPGVGISVLGKLYFTKEQDILVNSTFLRSACWGNYQVSCGGAFALSSDWPCPSQVVSAFEITCSGRHSKTGSRAYTL